MSLKTARFRIEGATPLIMHNARLVDPLDEITRQMKPIQGKRKKTNEDHAALARLEWQGGLYVDENDYPCLPGDNLTRMLREGAKSQKLGTKFQSAVRVSGEWKLEVPGNKTGAQMLTDYDRGDQTHVKRNAMRIKTDRVMRVRPVFPVWAVEFDVDYNPALVNLGDVEHALATAGETVGIGDSRPAFGRFTVASSKTEPRNGGREEGGTRRRRLA